MTNSGKTFTENSLKRLVSTYKDTDRDYLRRLLLRLFDDPKNVHLFGRFCFPHHAKLATPAFHLEIDRILLEMPGNKALGAPRGFAKSTKVNLIDVAWIICQQKRHFVLPISDTFSQSVEFVNTLRDELANNTVIKWLYGDLRGERWGDGSFITSTGIKVMARAYGMKIRGLKFRQYRPDLIIMDDLENDEAVQNPLQRAKLKKWVLRAVIPALAKGGEMWVIGTVLHGDSLLNNMLHNQGEFQSWTTRIFKAIVTLPGGIEQSLWPELYTLEQLRRMRDDPAYERYIGSIAFAQEMQNEPLSDEDSIFKESWICWSDSLPEGNPTKTIVTADPAISKKETADYFAKVGAKLYGDRKTGIVYIFALGNERQSFAEAVDDIVAWYTRVKPSKIYVEAVAYQEALRETLARKSLPVEAIKRDSDKRRRALKVSQYVEAGRVVIIRDIRHADTLFNQLIQFPLGAHDDLVDAFVDAIEKLIGETSQPKLSFI